MSTTSKQYLIYGISMSFEWMKEWENINNEDFYDRFEKFMDDDNDISCLYDGRDGRFIIIGKIINKSNDDDLLGVGKPIKVNVLNDEEILIIRNKVFDYFELAGEFHYYFITKFN